MNGPTTVHVRGATVEFVHIADDETRVRWRFTSLSGCRYICDEHGSLDEATCPHALEAALAVAARFLGVRASALPPDSTTDNPQEEIR